LLFAEIYTVIDLISIDSGGAAVNVPFTWKVTGWFMIGWSVEFPTGEVRPLDTSAKTLSPIATSLASYT
jgi:hypothetical protein